MDKHNTNKQSIWQKGAIVFGPLCKLGETVFELLIPFLMINLITLMSQTSSNQNQHSYSATIALLLSNRQFQFIIALSLLTGILAIAAQYFASEAASAFTSKLRKRIFEHFMHLDSLSQTSLGQDFMNTRIISDCLAIQNGLNLGLRLLIRSPFIIVGSIIMTFIINKQAALILTLAVCAIGILITYFLRKSLAAYKQMQNETKQLFRQISEAKNGLSCIRAFNAECKIIAKFAKTNKKEALFRRHFTLLNAYIAPLSQALINLALLYCLFTYFRLPLNLRLNAATLVAIYSYFSKSLIETIKFANLMVTLSKALGSYQLIRVFFQIKQEEKSQSENLALSSNSYALVVNNLSFSYPEDNFSVLENINLGELKSGKIYGIFGLQASGKSTLARILSGLYTCDNLKVKQNGQIINFASKTEQARFLRQYVAYVEQAPKLLAGTLRSNFRYQGQTDNELEAESTSQAIWHALELTQASNFVKAKGGLDCLVNEQSNNFSGGQLARLALAIALYRQPKILILDDFLQALDLSTALKLMQAIRAFSQNCLVICLSQRLATLINSEEIFILQGQNIICHGKHQDLLSSNAYYRELYELEFPNQEVSHG